jgi:hypothetical protein
MPFQNYFELDLVEQKNRFLIFNIEIYITIMVRNFQVHGIFLSGAHFLLGRPSNIILRNDLQGSLTFKKIWRYFQWLVTFDLTGS